MHITDHALVRYIDRRLRIGVDKLAETLGIEGDRNVLTYFAQHCRIDVEAWRQELHAQALQAAMTPPDCRERFWLDGLGYVVKEGVLVTVLSCGKPWRPKKLRRLPKIRQPAAIARLNARHGRVMRRKAVEVAQ